MSPSTTPQSRIPEGIRQRLIGVSSWTKRIWHEIVTLAQLDNNLLILGEPGTGKQVIGELIHEHSERREQPFQVLECRTTDPLYMETRLYGANGLFELAAGGTLLITEIELLPRPAMLWLRDTLANGDAATDVRLICTSQANQNALAAAGTPLVEILTSLWQDVVETVPLRDRRDDIPPLANFYWRRMTAEIEQPLSPEILQTLQTYDFVENVRGLWLLLKLLYRQNTGEVTLRGLKQAVAELVKRGALRNPPRRMPP